MLSLLPFPQGSSAPPGKMGFAGPHTVLSDCDLGQVTQRLGVGSVAGESQGKVAWRAVSDEPGGRADAVYLKPLGSPEDLGPYFRNY